MLIIYRCTILSLNPEFTGAGAAYTISAQIPPVQLNMLLETECNIFNQRLLKLCGTIELFQESNEPCVISNERVCEIYFLLAAFSLYSSRTLLTNKQSVPVDGLCVS